MAIFVKLVLSGAPSSVMELSVVLELAFHHLPFSVPSLRST